MYNSFEEMVSSIADQINPASMSVCYFRCAEFLETYHNYMNIVKNIKKK